VPDVAGGAGGAVIRLAPAELHVDRRADLVVGHERPALDGLVEELGLLRARVARAGLRQGEQLGSRVPPPTEALVAGRLGRLAA
jgi:hypothetical protein